MAAPIRTCGLLPLGVPVDVGGVPVAKALHKDYPLPKLAPRNHYHHWIDACLGRANTAAGFDYSGLLTETVLLGTVALLCAGKELAWDAERMEVTNVPEANEHLRRTYRNGWAVEGL